MEHHTVSDRAGPARANSSDTALWIVLIACLVPNAALSLLGLDLLALPFGTVAAVAGVALLVRYVRRRR